MIEKVLIAARRMASINGFRLSLFSGLPSFEKLRFAFGAGAKPVEISVK